MNMKYLKKWNVFEWSDSDYKPNSNAPKYTELEEEEFIRHFNENCKNFSLNNDPLYRGDEQEFKFAFHDQKIDRNTRGITYVDFFIQKEKDPDKYPVMRRRSTIGLGGGEVSSMKHACAMLGDNDFKDEGSPVYRVIPYDNAKIVFCPAFDLQTFKIYHKIEEVTDDDFVMVEYTKNFKVPVEELKEIQKRLVGKVIPKYLKFGFEFFMSSPALLINAKNESILKQI